MSVIAKMSVTAVKDFGDASLIGLQCVYENDGLNSEKWENRRFTKATPWGDGDLTTPHAVDFEKGKEFYLVFTPANDPENVYRPFGDCSLAMFVKCQKYEPWPGTVALELVKDRAVDCPVTKSTSINIRMAIDNEAASSQFTEGRTFYVCFYRADRVSITHAANGA